MKLTFRRFFRVAVLGASLISSLISGAFAAPAPLAAFDAVDPFIGTGGNGNTFPGATLPFGFIQVSPDTGRGSGAGGYKFGKNITGFSQQHISGMGGPLLGEISLFPLTGALEKPSELSAAKTAESSNPGYYSVTLLPSNVKVELTSARHVALHKYTFPAHDESRVVVDVGHCLFGTAANWGSAKPIGGEVSVDAAKQEVSGHMTYQGGRGNSRQWKVYFAARFDTRFSSYGTWDDAGKLTDGSAQGAGSEIGAYLNFKTSAGQVINSKVGVSWRSLEQARGYLTKETPTWDFEAVRRAARAQWTAVLDKIQVEGGTADQRKQFYTALYRIHVTPNNWTGEAPPRYGDQTYYENILCLWDTFRTVNPMLTLIQPKVQADIVNTLINYHKTDGWTGDSHGAHTYEQVQNGSNADNVIADAYAKKLPGVDWNAAYAAIRKNAFVDHNLKGTNRPDRGRFRLSDYRNYKYLPTDAIEKGDSVMGVSRTLEYIYNDFCVYSLAKDFGTPEDVADLKNRLLWYRNLWDETSGGFMRGKTKDGAWHSPFDPTKGETGPQFYEGHSWTWSWSVPHDAQGLINLMGGNQAFVDKLTVACDKYYEAYNEPCMLQTFLFIHAKRPDLTQFYARKALSNFSDKPGGLPGNDDSGTTSAWLLWTMLGLYPNAGQDFYYIGSPTFSRATIKLAGGKQLVINAPAASKTAKYISAGTLNGKSHNQAWLRHRDFIGGATLNLTMSANVSKWGAQTPPPSYSPALPEAK